MRQIKLQSRRRCEFWPRFQRAFLSLNYRNFIRASLRRLIRDSIRLSIVRSYRVVKSNLVSWSSSQNPILLPYSLTVLSLSDTKLFSLLSRTGSAATSGGHMPTLSQSNRITSNQTRSTLRRFWYEDSGSRQSITSSHELSSL